MPTTNVRVVPSLQFKDGSVYSGQVLVTNNTSQPHGYGVTRTKNGFTHRGYYHNGKSRGPGIFAAPNTDTFYGQWNDSNKRHGKGVFVRASDSLQLIEEYSDGKLVGKRVKRKPPSHTQTHWLASLDTDTGSLAFANTSPCARNNHSMSLNEDQSMLIVFGGESLNTDTGIRHSLNDVLLLDIATMNWLSPTMTGTVPPPIHSHTATVIDGNLLVIIGGQLTGIEANSNVYVLDLNTGHWSITVTKSIPLIHHSAAYLRCRQSIVVLVQGSCYELDLASWKWSELSLDTKSLRRSPRSFVGATMTEYRGHLIVIGGLSLTPTSSAVFGDKHDNGKKYERCISDVRVLDTERMTLSVVDVANASTQSSQSQYDGVIYGQPDTPRAYHSATLVDDRYLYVIGGWTTTNPSMSVVDENWLNDCQVLDVETMTWLTSPTHGSLSFIAPRANHQSAQVGSQLWVFGGRNAAEEAMKSWKVLQLPTEAPPAASEAASASGSDCGDTSTFTVHRS